MKTPREKYMNDPEYHQLVHMLQEFIERARFTPSELREAAVLASINYEMRHVQDQTIDPRAVEAVKRLFKDATGVTVDVRVENGEFIVIDPAGQEFRSGLVWKH